MLLVIPAYNRPGEVAQLLDSIRLLERGDFQLSIVVVDDAGTVPLAPLLEGRFDDLPLTILRNDHNRGPAFSRNRGSRSRDSDYVWFLDSDTEVCNPRTLLTLVSALENNPKIGAAGGVLEEQEGQKKVLQLTFQANGTFLYRALAPEQAEGGVYPDGLASANLFLSREVLDRAGGFFEGLRRDEDNDLCMTLAQMGYVCYQDRDTVVLNKIVETGRDSGAFAHFGDPKKYVRDLLDTRITLLARHFPWRLPILWLLDLIVIPMIFVQKKRGRFVTNRFNKAIPRASVPFLLWCVAKQLSSYVKGIAYFVGRSAAVGGSATSIPMPRSAPSRFSRRTRSDGNASSSERTVANASHSI